MKIVSKLDLSLSESGKHTKIVHVQFKRDESCIYIYMVSVGSIKNTFYIIKYEYNKQEEKGTFTKLASHHLTERQEHSLLTCSFDDETYSFLAFWSDGLLEIYNFGDYDPHISTSSSWSVRHSHSLNVFNAKKTKSRRSSISNLYNSSVTSSYLKPGFILLAGHLEAEKYLFLIWDVNYGLIHSSKEIDVSTIQDQKESTSIDISIVSKSMNGKSSKRSAPQVAVSSDKSSILINFGHKVVTQPITLGTSSLATVLGGYNLTKPFLKEENVTQRESIHCDSFLDKLKLPKSKKNDKKETTYYISTKDIKENHLIDQKEYELINSLSDRTKTPDYKSFMEVFEEYLDYAKKKSNKYISNVLDLYYGDQKDEKKYVQYVYGVRRRKKWKNLHEYSLKASESSQRESLRKSLENININHSYVCIEKIIERCLSEEFLWYPLKQIIESNLVSCKSFPHLFTKIMENDRYDVLVSSILYVQDISEKDLVNSLKYIISLDSSKLQIFLNEYSSQKFDSMQVESEDKEESKEPLDEFIGLIISVPSNIVFLRRRLRTLELKEVIILLQYFIRWFQRNLDNQTNQPNEIRSPSFDQVISWACATIDSHISKLILTSDCYNLIVKIHELVQENITLYNTMISLRGCLAYYFDHDTSPKDELNDYFVEVLRI